MIRWSSVWALSGGFSQVRGAAVAVAIVALVRLSDLAFSPLVVVAGEPVMRTADAYGWLAGTTGAGPLATHPLSRMLLWFAEVTGMHPAWVAYWLPVVFAAFVVACLSWTLASTGHRLPATTAGVGLGLALGFLGRTRLGQFDTDGLALLFPVMAACGVVIVGRNRRGTCALILGGSLCVAASAGVAHFYASGVPVLLAVLLCGALGAAWRDPARVPDAVALALVGAAGLTSSTGAVSLWLLWIGVRRRPWMRHPRLLKGGLSASGLLLAGAGLLGESRASLSRLAFFLGLEDSSTVGEALPSVRSIVAEARPATWDFMVTYAAGNAVVVALGGVALLYACWKERDLLAFLPLAALGCASPILGQRFAMYGAPALGIGLGVGLDLLARTADWPERARAVLQVVMMSVCILSSLAFLTRFESSPAISEEVAGVLANARSAGLGGKGTTWSWWDEGYAVDYYLGGTSALSGGTTTGHGLLALGAVYGEHCATRLKRRIECAPRDWQRLLRSCACRRDASSEERGLLLVNLELFPRYGWIEHFSGWRSAPRDSIVRHVDTVVGPSRIDLSTGLIRGAEEIVMMRKFIAIEEGRVARSHVWPARPASQDVLLDARSGLILKLPAGALDGVIATLLLATGGELRAALDEHGLELVMDEHPYARLFRSDQGSD